MILSPRAGGTVMAPPLITVPAGAVVMVTVWQCWQPIWLNRLRPATASGVAARAVSRGGTLVARMKRAKASTSGPNGSAEVGASSGSGTVSNAATEAPRSEEHTSELQSRLHLVCRLLLEKKKKKKKKNKKREQHN